MLCDQCIYAPGSAHPPRLCFRLPTAGKAWRASTRLSLIVVRLLLRDSECCTDGTMDERKDGQGVVIVAHVNTATPVQTACTLRCVSPFLVRPAPYSTPGRTVDATPPLNFFSCSFVVRLCVHLRFVPAGDTLFLTLRSSYLVDLLSAIYRSIVVCPPSPRTTTPCLLTSTGGIIRAPDTTLFCFVSLRRRACVCVCVCWLPY